jgi:hypothetical protein
LIDTGRGFPKNSSHSAGSSSTTTSVRLIKVVHQILVRLCFCISSTTTSTLYHHPSPLSSSSLFLIHFYLLPSIFLHPYPISFISLFCWHCSLSPLLKRVQINVTQNMSLQEETHLNIMLHTKLFQCLPPPLPDQSPLWAILHMYITGSYLP